MWSDLIFLSQLEVAELSSLKANGEEIYDVTILINWMSQLKWAMIFSGLIENE